MRYTLRKTTVVNTTLDMAWDFIRNPANLNLITPDDLHFEIVTDLPSRMYEGMIIEYRVKIPVIGRQSWVSELMDIVEGRSFADVQLRGPYKYWHHHHAIEPTDGGVLFTDQVTYEVPFGILGRVAHALFIRRTLERIFRHREERLQALLEPAEKIRAFTESFA